MKLSVFFYFFFELFTGTAWSVGMCDSGTFALLRFARQGGSLVELKHFLVKSVSEKDRALIFNVADYQGANINISLNDGIYGCGSVEVNPGMYIAVKATEGSHQLIAFLSKIEFEVFKVMQANASALGQRGRLGAARLAARAYETVHGQHCGGHVGELSGECSILEGKCSGLNQKFPGRFSCQKAYLEQASTKQSKKDLTLFCNKMGDPMKNACLAFLKKIPWLKN